MNSICPLTFENLLPNKICRILVQPFINTEYVISNYSCLKNAENNDPQFHFQYRGPVTMKGKSEPMKVWFLTRNKEYVV